MGLLESVLGSALGGSPQQGGGGALMSVIAAMLANGQSGGSAGGGLAGLIEQFQRSGQGDVIDSWVGTGQNQAISPDQLGSVLGGDLLGQLTRQTGMGEGDLLGQLSQVLPQLVDRATPEGHVPEGGLGDIGTILGRFGQP